MVFQDNTLLSDIYYIKLMYANNYVILAIIIYFLGDIFIHNSSNINTTFRLMFISKYSFITIRRPVLLILHKLHSSLVFLLCNTSVHFYRLVFSRYTKQRDLCIDFSIR